MLATYRDTYGDVAVLLSSDSGRTWQNFASEIPVLPGRTYNGCLVKDIDFNDILFSPAESNSIYIHFGSNSLTPCTGSAYHLLVSRDLGKSWKVEGNFDRNFYFRTDPYFADRAFASSGRTYVFTTTGLQPLTGHSIGNYTSFPENRNHLLDGNFESFDGGVTWKRVPRQFPLGFSRYLAMRTPIGGLLAISDGGLYKRLPGGEWIASNRGFKAVNVSAIAPSGNNIYALFGYKYLYHSSNSGKNWVDLSLKLPRGYEYGDIAVNPRNTSNIIISGRLPPIRPENRGEFFFVSFDSGQNWKLALRFDGWGPGQIQFHPLLSDVVYFTVGDVIFKSTNSGMNPKKLLFEFGVYGVRLRFDSTNPNLLFFVTCYDLYKSTDGGKTIEEFDTDLEPEEACIADIAPAGTGTQYIAADGWSYIYHTLSGGRKWSIISQLPEHTGGGGDSKGKWRLYPADFIGKHFYAIDVTLHETFDGGHHWKRVKPSPSGISKIGEIMEMSDPRIRPIYLATDKGVLILD